MIAEKDFAGRQSRGARDSQEDSYAFSEISGDSGEVESLLVVVADGMGGHAAGERASELALHCFVEQFYHAPGGTAVKLKTALLAANEAITQELKREPHYEGMGTTLVAACLTGDTIEWISVGDSPLYLWREEHLSRLNEDHSLRPVLDELHANREPPHHEVSAASRNILRAALTGDEIAMIDQSDTAMRLRPGDIIIAASDGIHTLPDEQISHVCAVSRAEEAQGLAENIIRLIKDEAHPRQDNTTIAVIKAPATAV